MTNERAIALVAAMHQYDGVGACSIEEREALRLMVQALVDKDALLEALKAIRAKAYEEHLSVRRMLSHISEIAEDAIAKAERAS